MSQDKTVLRDSVVPLSGWVAPFLETSSFSIICLAALVRIEIRGGAADHDLEQYDDML